MNKKKRDAKVISILFSFMQSLFMVALLSMVLLNIAVLTPNSIIRNLDRSSYYNTLRNGTISRVEDLLIPSGLPMDVINDVFEIDEFKVNVDGYIRAKMSREAFEFDTTRVEARFTENVEAFIHEEGIADYVDQEVVDGIIGAVMDTYLSGLEFPFVGMLGDYISVYQQMMWMVAPVCFVLMSFCIFMLFKINRWRHRFFRYQAYSFGAAALMIMGIPIAIKVWGGYQRLSIQPEYVNNFIVYHFDTAIMTFIIVGVALLTLELVFIAICENSKKKLRKRRRVRTHDADDNGELLELVK